MSVNLNSSLAGSWPPCKRHLRRPSFWKKVANTGLTEQLKKRRRGEFKEIMPGWLGMTLNQSVNNVWHTPTHTHTGIKGASPGGRLRRRINCATGELRIALQSPWKVAFVWVCGRLFTWSVLSDRGLNLSCPAPQPWHYQWAASKVTQTSAWKKQKRHEKYVCVFLCLNLTWLKGGPGVRFAFQFHFHSLSPRADGRKQGRIEEGETLPSNTWTPPHCDVMVFPWRHEAGREGPGGTTMLWILK